MTERIHAIVFDVDGTLTQSTVIDALCFERAVFETLGIRIDTDWASRRLMGTERDWSPQALESFSPASLIACESNLRYRKWFS